MIHPSELNGNVSFERFVQDGGWCSMPFFPLIYVLVNILQTRGIEFRFSRIGPVLLRKGEKLFLATTGYTPPAIYNLPLKDRATNYLHFLDMAGNPFFQVHCSEQHKIVAFMREYFAIDFASMPITEQEEAQIAEALSKQNHVQSPIA